MARLLVSPATTLLHIGNADMSCAEIRLSLSNNLLKLFEDGGVLATAAASQLHIGNADRSLRRNPAILIEQLP
jgi:hypothetical protein